LIFEDSLGFKKQKAADGFHFGSQAICRTDPVALRPCLATGLPFRLEKIFKFQYSIVCMK
jgi:hypothetical protein